MSALEKQVTTRVKACDSFVRAERFVEQIRALTKEVNRLKAADARKGAPA
jgi:uncharacterized small protein (DUF1192 family)